jgi:two-component system, OmpR family, response regulator
MRVLVVEDHAKMRSVLRRGLEDAGFEVTTVGDGSEALRLADSGTQDLVVLDVMLPVVDGFTVCRELRRRGNEIPILMLTARDAVDDRVAGLDGGADDYLVKPFAFAELVSRVRSLMRRAAPASPATLRCGPLVADLTGRTVVCRDEPIELSATEFDLLCFLLRHPNQVLSRTAILDHVWEGRHDGFSNIVDVYVKYLRDKIDRRFGLDLVQTVRGLGYRLTCPSGP